MNENGNGNESRGRGRYAALSVRDLAAAVEHVAPRDSGRWEAREPAPGALGVPARVSRGRARQLWMVVGMWDRALQRDGFPAAARRSAAGLFTEPVLARFWELARAGELRALAPERGRAPQPPPATLRIVRDCLRILAALVRPGDRAVRLPSVAQPELKAPVRARSLAAVYRGLADLAGQGPLEGGGTTLSYEDRTRLLAMVAIVLAAAPRSGELAALRLSDLAPEERAVAVRRRQQKAPPNRAAEIAGLAQVHPSAVRAVLWGRPDRLSGHARERVAAARTVLPPAPDIEWYRLGEGARVAVRSWLRVRELLLAQSPLRGGQPGLWVTLVPTRTGPPGITLRPQGLTQAYARGMAALNLVMAGQHGWEPMPGRLEQLRRAVTAEPLDPSAARSWQPPPA
ncbi:hypothetical protein [Streptomyces sp. NPDC006552]|uniref:hypothetical protein n=1 Tax=Streptomyces sp. NPDC006552 TaxID=3157179 RepID=UPI0033A9753B